jgi:hypothetical protein
MAITSLFGPTPEQIQQARQLQMDQQIAGEGAELGPFRGLYQAGRRLGSAGTQGLVSGLFPEAADPTLREAQAVEAIRQKYMGQNMTDPKVLQQMAVELGPIAPMASLRLAQTAKQLLPEVGKNTITVPAGSTVIDPTTGKVLFTAPKEVKADNKVLPPGSVMVDSAGNVIARGTEPKGTAADVSPEWKRYQELLRLGTPEPEARATAYKTAALDFRKDLEEVRKQENMDRKQQQFANTAGIIDNVMNTLDSAVKQTGTFTAGSLGTPLSFLPGTPAKDLSANLETIKANLGFDRLQQMRDASPTGGALGQVAIQELVALQSTVASLDIQQSPAQLRKNLNKVKGHYTKWRETVKKAMEQNSPTIGETAPSTQSGWSIVR